MITLHVSRVQEALFRGLDLLTSRGVRRDSRNGPVYVMPCPVVTIYDRPCERVLFDEERDANPFFHLIELVWMLAGSRDLRVLTKYVPRFREYSDDGGATQNAAYGHRLRHNAGDQLRAAIWRLRRDRSDRRVVLEFHDATRDTFHEDPMEGTDTRATIYVGGLGEMYVGKDAACNLTATLQVHPVTGKLDMVVFCRSNDIIWGAYGANAVHMSGILEYIAAHSELEVGTYTQISVNYHAYVDVCDRLLAKWGGAARYDASSDPYQRGDIKATPLVKPGESREQWDLDAEKAVACVLNDGLGMREVKTRFIRDVVGPMIGAHRLHKQKRTEEAIELLLTYCAGEDWRRAGVEWLVRRAK